MAVDEVENSRITTVTLGWWGSAREFYYTRTTQAGTGGHFLLISRQGFIQAQKVNIASLDHAWGASCQMRLFFCCKVHISSHIALTDDTLAAVHKWQFAKRG